MATNIIKYLNLTKDPKTSLKLVDLPTDIAKITDLYSQDRGSFTTVGSDINVNELKNFGASKVNPKFTQQFTAAVKPQIKVTTLFGGKPTVFFPINGVLSKTIDYTFEEGITVIIMAGTLSASARITQTFLNFSNPTLDSASYLNIFLRRSTLRSALVVDGQPFANPAASQNATNEKTFYAFRITKLGVVTVWENSTVVASGTLTYNAIPPILKTPTTLVIGRNNAYTNGMESAYIADLLIYNEAKSDAMILAENTRLTAKYV